MRIRRALPLAALLVVSVMAAGALLYGERIINARHEKATLSISDSDMDLLRNIRFFMPADENRGLHSDIRASIFEEDELQQYFILPDDANNPNAVIYSTDEFGNLLNRYIVDTTAPEGFDVGLRHINFVTTKLHAIFMNIDAESPTYEEFSASEDKSVMMSANLTLSAGGLYKGLDSINGDLGHVTVTGRGNTTWMYSPKKPMTIAFDKAKYIPGLGKHKRFNLINNCMDRSLLNNEVFIHMADNAGISYEPSCEQVTVYIDGEYEGVYLLTTKVSVAHDRIDLKNGDFLINWGGTGAIQPIFYESKTWLDDGSDFHDPYAELEWPEEASEADKANIREKIQRFITTVEDPTDGSYTEYMDLDSMVWYYWIQEIGMNYDAAFRSTYSYYKADTSKIYMGPVWDMDLCLGWNADKCGAYFTTPEGWKIRVMSWYVPLFEREDFREAVKDAYINGGIRETMFNAIAEFESEMNRLDTDGQMNYRRWRSEVPDLALRYGDSYMEEAQGRLNFFKARAAWIDSQMMAE